MKQFTYLVLLLSVVTLSACGGSSSSSTNPPVASSSSLSSSSEDSSNSSSSSSSEPPASAPENLSITPEPVKQFIVSWDLVEDSTYYRLYENTDGMSGYQLVADDITETSYAFEVALYEKLNASYLVQACNEGGCSVDSDAVYVGDNLNDAIGYFKPPVTASSSAGLGQLYGGFAMSADGNTLAVNISLDLEGREITSGNADAEMEDASSAIYIYRKNDQGWLKTDTIEVDYVTFSDMTLSADGNVLVVGDIFDGSGSLGVRDAPGTGSLPYSGAAHIYRYADSWQREAFVKPSILRENDRFGDQVQLSHDGNTLFVSATFDKVLATGVHYENLSSLTTMNVGYVGAVYAFTYTNNGWVEEAYIKGNNTELTVPSASLGSSLAVSADGQTLAVGDSGYAESPTEKIYSSVHFYKYIEGTWQAAGMMNSPNPEQGSAFGAAVALSADGSVLAVSESYDLRFSYPDRSMGRLHMYERADADTWELVKTITPPEGLRANRFGSSLAMSGDGAKLAVCAPSENYGGVGISEQPANETTGWHGVAYIFSQEDDWVNSVYVQAPHLNASQGFCEQIALSEDGDTLAIGAPREDGSAEGINGGAFDTDAPNSGALYLY